MPDKELEAGQFWEFRFYAGSHLIMFGPYSQNRAPFSILILYRTLSESHHLLCANNQIIFQGHSLASCLVPSLIPWTALFEVFIPHKIVYRVSSMFLQTSKWFLQSIQVCPNNQLFFMKSLTCLCQQQNSFPKSFASFMQATK